MQSEISIHRKSTNILVGALHLCTCKWKTN